MLVEAQQFILAAWVVLSAVLVGLGLLERRFFGSPVERAGELWQVFWMGFALLLVLLQLWHFALPVDHRARAAFLVLALAGWLSSGLVPWRAASRSFFRHAPALVLIALFAWWFSNRCLQGPRFGDTGMYFIPAIRWIEAFPIVPGLANLFVPLGHNVSYFHYAAFLDAGPFTDRIYHTVNSIMVLALVARGLVALGNLLRPGTRRLATDLFYALALVPTSDLLFTLYLTSPSPDAAVFLYELVLAGELVDFAASRRPSRGAFLRLVFLSGTGLTIKLSAAGFSLAVAGVAGLLWLWRSPSRSEAVRGTLAAALVGLVPTGIWMVRTAVMTGYPLYPSSLMPLPVDWIARVDATAWIQKPMAMAPMWSVFTQPDWWRMRLISLGWTEGDALRPLVLIAVSLVVFAIARPLSWWRGRGAVIPSLILLVPLVSFFFTFANTPMPRYQGSTLWILGCDLLVLALAGWIAASGWSVRLAAASLVVVGAVLPLLRGAEPWLDYRDFEGASGPRIHSEKLASGLVVNVPENQVCWDAPLPCTPEPHPGLRLRDPDDLGAGFAIDAP